MKERKLANEKEDTLPVHAAVLALSCILPASAAETQSA